MKTRSPKSKNVKSAFILAGVSSGVGKTTLTLGLIRALKNANYTVQPFKAGPDFIDPVFHRLAAGRASYNLDTWMMGEKNVLRSFSQRDDWNIGIVEGVMGLFDGRGDSKNNGSAASLAKLLGLPVILVVNGASIANSIAAVVHGFESFDRGVRVAGVIFNNVNSERHFELLRAAVVARCNAKVLGYLSEIPDAKISSRHLGLKLPADDDATNQKIEMIAAAVERTVQLKQLIALTRIKPDNGFVPDRKKPPKPNRTMIKLGVAYDQAFCFYYEDNFSLLQDYGAELIFFSPLKDKKLPRGIQGLYLGGGYPEVFASRLSKNVQLRDSIRESAALNLPIYGECGGLMYLGKSLIHTDQSVYPMAGVFPWVSHFPAPKRILGYRDVVISKASPFFPVKAKIRGHEFHYSNIAQFEGVETIYAVRGKTGAMYPEGYRIGNALASYVHVHFASNVRFAESFVSLCRSAGVIV